MEWTKIEDEEPQIEVLCINKRNDYLIGYVGKTQYGAWQAENDNEVLEYVTHWMPLPSPPSNT